VVNGFVVSRPTSSIVRCCACEALQEYCLYETFVGRCWRGEVIVMQSALWGRMKSGRCLQLSANFLKMHGNDPMFIGCFQDVLPLADSKCSGRPECSILISDPSFNNTKPCYADLKMYFEASYQCVRGRLLRFNKSQRITFFKVL